MTITCADEAKYIIELDEFGAVSPEPEFCIECGEPIPPGEEYYRVWERTIGDTFDSQLECCEQCGDLALSWMELGYCWNYTCLRDDIAEVNA